MSRGGLFGLRNTTTSSAERPLGTISLPGSLPFGSDTPSCGKDSLANRASNRGKRLIITGSVVYEDSNEVPKIEQDENHGKI